MHSSDGEDTGGGVANGIGSLRAVHVRYLQTKDARDDLQAVLDAVVNLLQQEFLLLHLRLERSFGLFELAAFVEVAKFLELGEQTCAHVTASGFRILQQHTRELLVDAEEFARVFFEKEFRMKHRPVMGGADEGEQAQQVLVAIAAQSLIQGASGAL